MARQGDQIDYQPTPNLTGQPQYGADEIAELQADVVGLAPVAVVLIQRAGGAWGIRSAVGATAVQNVVENSGSIVFEIVCTHTFQWTAGLLPINFSFNMLRAGGDVQTGNAIVGAVGPNTIRWSLALHDESGANVQLEDASVITMQIYDTDQ